MINLINIDDLESKDIYNIITDNVENKILNKIIGLLFEKPSTRTKTSFISSIHQLGCQFIDFKKDDLNLSRDESLEDTAKALNCYIDGLIVRTDDHSKIIKINENFDKPIINALSDLSHPCQGLSDLNYLFKYFGKLEFNIVWMGDITNVCLSILDCIKKIDKIKISIISHPDIISNHEKRYSDFKNINFFSNVEAIILNEASCVMTDVFISMNDIYSEDKIEKLLKYQVNKSIFEKVNKNCIFMHCLPAKIGFEVSESILNSDKSHVWQQAKNKMYNQKTILQYINWT
tara:strand:- start:210 stop:1076 length:867 start_codon:yes stop_codon:yes gene_type:complete